VTEEEEDEEYLKEEEGGLGNTRLVTQPSCKFSFFHVYNSTCLFALMKAILFFFLLLE
jgi:hypothetical protein